MEKQKLKELIVQHTNFALQKTNLYQREISNIEGLILKKEIIVITGVRRCGKSSLMRIFIQNLFMKTSTQKENFLYINFEDERFVNFSHEDFEVLYETYLELNNPQGKQFLFFDEIQNIEHWSRWINRLYEFENVKIFITGSNATLLSGEIATSITGRNIPVQLYPFSFREFLGIKGISISSDAFYNRDQRVLIKKNLTEYIESGGFPESGINNDSSILQYYFQDILLRDIITRYQIRNTKEIKELALYLSSNISNLCSYRKLSSMISVKSLNTVKNYLDHLENAFLFFRMGMFDYSLKKQMNNPYKMYCVDTALARSVSFNFSQDLGRIYENIVFIELLRNGYEVYYWKSKQNYEVDFLIRQGRDIIDIIQVSLIISNAKTKEREIRSILEASKTFNLKKAKIITEDYASEHTENGVHIDFIPLWQWLISDH